MSYEFSYKDWRDDPNNSVAFLVKADEQRTEELPPTRSSWNELAVIVWNSGFLNRIEINLDHGYDSLSSENMVLDSQEELDALISLLQKAKNLMELQPAKEVGRVL